jgi:radical SAM protein with 4Fe4S-binding SPASM domain
MVYNTLNVNSLVDIAHFAIDCGANSISLSPCTPAIDKTGANSDFMIEPAKLVSNIIRDYQKLSRITEERLSFSMKLPLCLWPEDFIDMLIEKRQITTVCQLQMKNGIIFSEDGSLTLCNSLFDYPIAKYGIDFVKGNELLAFLNTRKVVDFYDDINTYPSEKCITCKKFVYCGGGCVLLWAVYNAEQVIKGYK